MTPHHSPTSLARYSKQNCLGEDWLSKSTKLRPARTCSKSDTWSPFAASGTCRKPLLAKGSLESSGIECFLTDDNMVRMDWFISNLLGGIKLAVNQEDVEAATAILDEPAPEILDVDGVGEYQQPRCPECQSLDVNFEQLSKVAYASAWLGIPIPLHDKAWTCRSCGHHWQDQDSVDPRDPEQP